MRRLLFVSGLLLLLTACAATAVRFDLTFDTKDSKQQSDLIAAAVRVIDRRLQAIDSKLLGSSVQAEGDIVHLTVNVKNADAAGSLREQLKAPFTFQIMRHTKEGETPDIDVKKFGGFKSTGITEKHVIWATSAEDTATQKGRVTITFNKEGGELLKKVFAENQGKIIGIFVRGRLVSQKEVTATDKQESILIDGIPSLEIANIFADDVNTGVHVHFQEVASTEN